MLELVVLLELVVAVERPPVLELVVAVELLLELVGQPQLWL